MSSNNKDVYTDMNFEFDGMPVPISDEDLELMLNSTSLPPSGGQDLSSFDESFPPAANEQHLSAAVIERDIGSLSTSQQPAALHGPEPDSYDDEDSTSSTYPQPASAAEQQPMQESFANSFVSPDLGTFGNQEQSALPAGQESAVSYNQVRDSPMSQSNALFNRQARFQAPPSGPSYGHIPYGQNLQYVAYEPMHMGYPPMRHPQPHPHVRAHAGLNVDMGSRFPTPSPAGPRGQTTITPRRPRPTSTDRDSLQRVSKAPSRTPAGHNNRASQAPKAGKLQRAPLERNTKGRTLMRWNLGTDQLIVLAIQYELLEQGLNLDWAKVGRHLDPNHHASAEAIGQHLVKVRHWRKDHGQRVPPQYFKKRSRKQLPSPAETPHSRIKREPRDDEDDDADDSEYENPKKASKKGKMGDGYNVEDLTKYLYLGKNRNKQAITIKEEPEVSDEPRPRQGYKTVPGYHRPGQQAQAAQEEAMTPEEEYESVYPYPYPLSGVPQYFPEPGQSLRGLIEDGHTYPQDNGADQFGEDTDWVFDQKAFEEELWFRRG